MAHILIYGPKMAQGHEHHAALRTTEEKLENDMETEQAPHGAAGRRNSLADKAKDMFHEVADMTKEMAHEVKEKIIGHITEKDIVNAAQKVADLRAQLANDQHELKQIQLAAEFAEQSLNLQEYEALKEKERKAKNDEREIEREIAEAEGDYIRLQSALMLQKQAHKHKS